MFQGGVWEKGYEVLKLRGGAGPKRHILANLNEVGVAIVTWLSGFAQPRPASAP